MKRKRRRKKKIIRIIVIIIITIIFLGILFLLPFAFLHFDVNKVVKISLGEQYDYQISAKLFSQNISEKVKVKGKVDENKVGKYKITYFYDKFFWSIYKKKITVIVCDVTPPTIELKEGDAIDIILNNEFKDPGYEVIDNYDQEVKVTVRGEVDTTKAGSYYLTYTAVDSSGNKAEVVRKVNVIEKNPADVDIDKFNIHDYFDSSVILEETEDYGEEYISKIAFVGDSVPWQFGLQYQWDSNNVYAAACTGPSNIYSQKAYWKNALTSKTIPELIKENKPEYILVSIGFCEIVSSGNVENWITNYGKFIEDIKENSPDTKIILNSMYPVISETLRGNEVPTNKQTNEYNYYTALIARKYKLKYLDSASVVKNSAGLAEPSLTASDGYHPNISGMKKIINYIRTHGYK